MEEKTKVLTVHGKLEPQKKIVGWGQKEYESVEVLGYLRDFRSKPCFDIIYYTPQNSGQEALGSLLEDLCYCRMLLQPGGVLYIQMDDGGEREWLRQAGFTAIFVKKIEGDRRMVGGKRPVWQF